MVLKEISSHDHKKANWEEIPEDDLWEDGELDTQAVIFKMYSNVCRLGEWKLIRRINNND
tara:strand:+ start:818 stop:997 length:180 start_codon:yes stop_codon:yes gene_type:complete